MSYESWSWNDITGGESTPDDFECEWKDPIFSQESESGLITTEPLFTNGYWIFTLDFKCVRPWSFVDFIDFYYRHRGGRPFYFRFPFELAGVPEEAYYADPGGLGPWASEVDPGAGESFTKLVAWLQDSLKFKRIHSYENIWEVNGQVVLRQVL